MKQFIYRINGQDYIVAVNKLEDSVAEVAVNGTNYQVELINNEEEEVTISSRPSANKAPAAASTAKTVTANVAAKTSANSNSAGALKSPLPGVIVGIKVNVGDKVSKGQEVAVLEAMKMENVLNAPVSGTVASINVNQGDSILEGVTILVIE